jgi:tetratricopeptide (TPR) repeat protein
MKLDRADQLYLEAAEDFDIYRGGDTIGETTATQVKDRPAQRVTLRTPDVTEAINNYWDHVERNKGRRVRLRFLTTAERGVEAGNPLPSAGLDYWEAAANGSVPVAPLRSFLLTLSLSDGLRKFIEPAEDEALRVELLTRIQWDTGSRTLDGIKSVIEDELVAVGMPLGVPPLESERALNSLLAGVANLLASDGDRRLTYADFCRAFQDATMAVVPRGQAEAIRGAFIAPAQPPVALAAVLGDPLPLVRGASLRSRLVDELAADLRTHGALLLWGSTGLGKTSLASLVTERASGKFAWASFRGQEPALIAQRLATAASELAGIGGSPRIVLDDLDLASASGFERELVRLFFQVRRMGGLVITTGYTSCPEELLEKLWLSSGADRQIPYFDETDVCEVLRNHSAPSGEYVVGVARLIVLATRGHPQFVHARIRKLSSQGWPQPSPEDLLADWGVANVRAQARRRLMNELPSDTTRLLAHRLTLSIGPFTRGHAFAVASVSPGVLMPGESLDTLVGPWVERVGDDAYRVSPLLEGAGTETLPSREIAAVHEALALYPFTKGKVTPAEIGTALLHGLAAQSTKALGQLAQFLLTKKFASVPGATEALFVLPAMALGTGQRLFRGDPALEVMLRIIQFRTASAAKKYNVVDAIIDRTLDALPHLKKSMRAHIAAFAYGTFLSDVTVPIPPTRTIPMLTAFMRIPEQDARLADVTAKFATGGHGIPASLSGFSPFQTLFYFESARIAAIESLDALLTQLESLSQPDRAHLLRVFDDEAFSSLLVNNAWLGDAKLKRLDTARALAVCERARTCALEWASRPFARAASLAVAVVHDEYRHDAASALAALDRAAGDFGQKDGRVLLGRGKVLYGTKEWLAAIDAFEAGLVDQTIDPVDRVFGLRLLGVAAANAGDWGKAASAFQEGSAVARSHHEVLRRMGTGLKADTAYAQWKGGRVQESLRLYAEVLQDLEEVPIDRDLRSRHLHATVRHAIAWVCGYETNSRRPPPMAEPIPGMCSNQEPNEGIADVEIRDLDTLWPLLVAVDERVGAGVGLAEIARKRQAGLAPIVVQALERGTAVDGLRHGKGLAEAPRTIVRFTESVVAQGSDEAKGWDKAEIGALPPKYWDDPARETSLVRLLLAAAVVATSEGVAIAFDSWREQLSQVGALTSPVARFLALLADTDEAPDGTLLQEAATSLAKIRKGGLSPKVLFECHFRLLNAVAGGDAEYLAGHALEKLTLAWKQVSQNQRFALVAPADHCPMLEERCASSALSGISKVANVLEVAARAVGARLAPEARAFLKRLVEQPQQLQT